MNVYYLPAQRRIVGTVDRDFAAYLYASYMRCQDPSRPVDRTDGASVYLPTDSLIHVLTVVVDRSVPVYREPCCGEFIVPNLVK